MKPAIVVSQQFLMIFDRRGSRLPAVRRVKHLACARWCEPGAWRSNSHVVGCGCGPLLVVVACRFVAVPTCSFLLLLLMLLLVLLMFISMVMLMSMLLMLMCVILFPVVVVGVVVVPSCAASVFAEVFHLQDRLVGR